MNISNQLFIFNKFNSIFWIQIWVLASEVCLNGKLIIIIFLFFTKQHVVVYACVPYHEMHHIFLKKYFQALTLIVENKRTPRI